MRVPSRFDMNAVLRGPCCDWPLEIWWLGLVDLELRCSDSDNDALDDLLPSYPEGLGFLPNLTAQTVNCGRSPAQSYAHDVPYVLQPPTERIALSQPPPSLVRPYLRSWYPGERRSHALHTPNTSRHCGFQVEHLRHAYPVLCGCGSLGWEKWRKENKYYLGEKQVLERGNIGRHAALFHATHLRIWYLDFLSISMIGIYLQDRKEDGYSTLAPRRPHATNRHKTK